MTAPLKVWREKAEALLPCKAHEGDLGYDLFAAESLTLEPGKSMAVSTGIRVEFPPGWGGIIKDRSSMASRGLYTSAGVIDQGYRGEIKVLLRNGSPEEVAIARGDKIAQLLPTPVVDWDVAEVTEERLNGSSRNSGGFGSTGK